MANLWIQEEFVNSSKGYRYGDSEVYETSYEEKGELYKFLRREYGRCTSRVYIDTKDGPKSIGWVFVKRAKYDDCKETYLQETWVTVHTAPPTKTVEYHYEGE